MIRILLFIGGTIAAFVGILFMFDAFLPKSRPSGYFWIIEFGTGLMSLAAGVYVLLSRRSP